MPKIYKITSPNTNRIYIGSCKTTLKSRMSRHMNDYHSGIYTLWENRCAARHIIHAGDPCIIELEDCPDADTKQLLAKEKEWIKNCMDECVNIQFTDRHQESLWNSIEPYDQTAYHVKKICWPEQYKERDVNDIVRNLEF